MMALGRANITHLLRFRALRRYPNRSALASRKSTISINFPPRSVCLAKATVHEAGMDDPYKLTFHFGGELRSIYGTWAGRRTKSTNSEACMQYWQKTA